MRALAPWLFVVLASWVLPSCAGGSPDPAPTPGESGEAPALEDVVVFWPGGGERAIGDLARGELVTVTRGEPGSRESWIRPPSPP
jgi:hypothetical protein